MSNLSDEEIHFERERARSLAGFKAVLNARDEELSEARNSIGPKSTRWQSLDSEFKSAKGTCQDIFAVLQRLTDAWRINWVLLPIAGAVFAALEAPINKFMLDNILRGSNIDSYAISLFVTVTMLTLAHIAGVQARQIKGSYEDRIYWGKILAALIILSFLALLVGALTIGRAYYSTAGFALPSSNIFVEIQLRVQKIGPWAAFVEALSDQAAFFLACINMAGIVGAFFLAFVSHDSDKVYQAALDKSEKLHRKFDRVA